MMPIFTFWQLLDNGDTASDHAHNECPLQLTLVHGDATSISHAHCSYQLLIVMLHQ